MDKFQKTIIVALSVTVASVFLLFWFINTFSEPNLNEIGFENQSCSTAPVLVPALIVKVVTGYWVQTDLSL